MYLPLSLKYRPQTFDEIIGQEHIATTLKNAISSGKIANAYLFTGPRGIGKTSTARIFAKGLNCEKGPTEKPCNKCVACQEISKGNSLDVLEIDGASNRGIDEIRNLRENVRLKPIYGKYRIYIIDEVHMLTVEAFNALLKTLEEPPPHVKFIFATTKVYKVLPTIISRCQRFDFRMIQVPVMVEKLREIAKEEKLDVQEEALFLIAKNAEGSLRDAQMVLDQLASFTKGSIRSDDVSKMFGTLGQDPLTKISEAIINNNGPLILHILNELINSGRDAIFITNSLIEHFRNLLIMSMCKEPSSHIMLSEEDLNKLKDLSHKFSIEELFYIVYTLSNALDLIGRTSLGRIPLEVALLKLSRKEKMIPVNEIMKKISQLEESLGQSQRPEVTMDEGRWKKDDKSSIIHHPSSIGAPVVPDADTLFQRLKGVWPEVIREVKNRKMSVGSYLGEGSLLELKDNMIIVGFSKSNSLHKEMLEKNENKDIVIKALRHILEIDLNINFVFSRSTQKSEDEALEEEIDRETFKPPTKKVEPIIESAVDIFDGKIVRGSEGE